MFAAFRLPRTLLVLLGGVALSFLGPQFQIVGSFLAAHHLRELPVETAARALPLALFACIQVILTGSGFFFTAPGGQTALAYATATQGVVLSLLGVLGFWWLSGRPNRSLYRMTAWAVLSTILAVALTQLIGRSTGAYDYLRLFVDLIHQQVTRTGTDLKADGPMIETSFSLVTKVLPAVFCIGAATVFYLGAGAWFNLVDRDHPFAADRLRRLRLPMAIIWVVIGAWILVLLPRFTQVPPAMTLVGVNVLAFSAFLFLAQGMGIVSHWLIGLGRGAWPSLLAIGIVLVAALFFQPVILFFATALIGLGLFDPWFNYRKI